MQHRKTFIYHAFYVCKALHGWKTFRYTLNEKYVVGVYECMVPRNVFRPEWREFNGNHPVVLYQYNGILVSL